MCTHTICFRVRSTEQYLSEWWRSLPSALIHRDERETSPPDTAVPCCQQDQKDSESLDLCFPLEQKSFPSSYEGDQFIVVYEPQAMSQ